MPPPHTQVGKCENKCCSKADYVKNKRYSPYYQDHTYTLHQQWQLYNFYNSFNTILYCYIL